jgi:hypothetical protein
MIDSAKRHFYATMSGTPEREAEEKIARDRKLQLSEAKMIEAFAAAARPVMPEAQGEGAMTIAEFRHWHHIVTAMFTQDPTNGARAWAEQVRPFDPALADLYVRSAEAHEAIYKHILSRAEHKE